MSVNSMLQVGMDMEQLAIAHTREVPNPTAALEPVLRHPLQLQSAYMEVTGVEPAFTSSHLRFHGTVDYIWYTPEVSLSLYMPVHVSDPWTGCRVTPQDMRTVHLQVYSWRAWIVAVETAEMLLQAGNVTVVPRRVLDPPVDCANTGLPTANCPSDHICIVCDFALVYKASPSPELSGL